LGYVLLQNEENGEAWYVNPTDGLRYYFGSAVDAFGLMKRFGLGISNKDFSSYKDGVAPDKLSGRILIKPEDAGRAYYVNPITSIMEYLAKPQDAFKLLINSALGITNNSIRKIDVGK